MADIYCDKLKIAITKEEFILPSKNNKWFFTFLVTLLNDMTFALIQSKISKISKKSLSQDKDLLFGIIENPDNIISTYGYDNINDFTKNMKEKLDIKEELYNYIISNNLYNYFLLPFYLNYLGFNCITFEYFNNTVYGGIYKYLDIVKNFGKNNCVIDFKQMKKSSGLNYDQRKENHPDFLLIDMWENDTNFFKDIKEEDKTSIQYNGNLKVILNPENNKLPEKKIEYNGYNYILKSELLTNYNTNEYKKPQHTIAITNCNDDYYAFGNYFIKRSKKAIITAYLAALNKLSEIPCKKLFKLNLPNKKILLSENSCDIINGKKKIKETDEKNNYCFSIKKGKRVLIYIKGEKLKTTEEKAKENAEKIELQKMIESKRKADADDAKIAKQNKQETQAEKNEREDKDKLCRIITDYLKKIKTNQDKDIILKQLKDKEDNYEKKKRDLIKLKDDITQENRKNQQIMTDLIHKFEAEIKKK